MKHRILILSLFAAIICVPAYAELVHRYSFSGDLTDSVGTADGLLVNNGSDAYFTGSSLEMENSELPNSNSTSINYVDLPNGIISSLGTAATFEAWVTWYGPSSSTWQRIFDFGTSDAGEDQSVISGNSTYLFLTPNCGTYRFGYRKGSELGTPEERTINSTSLPVNTQVHVAIVWNDITQEVRMFYNGQLVDSGPLHFTLADLPDVNVWLGRSQWPDTGFNGSYHEFRIYNNALPDAMILASYQSGPETPIATYQVPSNPSPAHQGQTGDLTPTLTWQSDPSADITAHRVYLGTDYDAVLNATTSTTGIYRGIYLPGNESFTPATELDLEQTYYWRIEEVTAGYTFSGPVWSFETVNLKANLPLPADDAEGIAVNYVTLQWQPGSGADGHRILFGTSAASLDVLESDYALTTYTLGSLEYDTTYFWRIDELYEGAPDVTGDTWSFTTMSPLGPCLLGDLNDDCRVTILDLVVFAGQWLDPAGCIGHEDNSCADFVGDDGVNQNDFAVLAEHWGLEELLPVVINEIYYHPDNNTEPVEFVELYNAGDQPIDLNGWYFGAAIDYSFQGVPVLNPGGYLVICENPSEFAAKFGVSGYGPFEGKLSNDGEKLVLRNAAGKIIDEVDYSSEFPWPVAANGEGASMELIHPSLDNDLAGSWRSSGYQINSRPELSFGAPTPGAVNGVYAAQVPPQIRQVAHNPSQPLSSQAITVTAKITDPDGIQAVTLKYQLNTPGSYIPAYLPISVSSLMSDPYQLQPINAEFENAANWDEIIMVDDGTGQDEVAGDAVYTAVIPAQGNRTLVRYRIEATDTSDTSVRVPYADDKSLNFACYVYDGVPDYVASKESVSPDGAGHVYSSDMLTSVPVYSLITRASDMYMCNGYNASDQFNQNTFDFNYQEAARRYNWEGAFVYDGKVYDHIQYRLRGGNGRYNGGLGGKRSMKFRFNRGSYFQARDMYGKKLPFKWKNLNTGKMFGNQVGGGDRRYPYGLNEIVNYFLYEQANVPSPKAWWFHFRVVDGIEEAPATTNGQYEGDFYGLHLAFENYDHAFLKRLGLPDGNLYKLSDKVNDGLEQLRYQAPDAVDDASDYENIRWNLTHEASADFIRNHLDCDEWYRYHTISEAIRHYDVFSGAECWHCLKNMAWYFLPEYSEANSNLGMLWFIPFDFDDTWGPYWNAGVDHAKAAIYDQRYTDYLEQFTIQPEKSPLRQEYRNYIREFRDLHWQPEVIDTMIDEFASVIEDFVPADRDRWRLNYTTPGTPVDFGTLEEGIAVMKDFAWSFGGSNLDSLADAENDAANLPNTPVVTYIGTAGYPENDLQFQTGTFSDPQGNETFAAMKWRIAEVDPSMEDDEWYTDVLISSEETGWAYYRGIDEGPSDPADAWTAPQFDDNAWLVARTSIGYGDNDDSTDLSLHSYPMQGNYTTIYLRKTFEMLNVNNLLSVDLNVYVDDGCIIYINGTEVARHHCTAGTKSWDSVSGETVDNASWETVTLSTPYNYFVEGDNTIAIHVLNQSLTSSDLSIDVELTATFSFEPTSPQSSDNHKYEIDALWESDDLTTFKSDIIIPANGVKPGRTYRVRCKMKDDTGRWSHWSDPIEFIAGEPVITDLRSHLRIAEVMYNNGDAEFIEFTNTGTTTLDLSTVSMTDGVDFTFEASSIQSLAPGAFVLVIKDQAAFEAQYGTGFNSLIAGEFTAGSLSNSGETIKIEDLWDGTLIEFDYNDARGWPLAADGAGHSLVPQVWAIEDQPLGTLNYGGNWRQSTYIGGSPGSDDPITAAGVVINECMAHTDFNDPVNYPGYDSNDWIELYNAGDSTVNFDGNWYLTDDIDELNKWPLPSSSLPSGGIVSFDEITGFHQPIDTGFGLDKAGEQIILSYLPGTSQDRVIDCIQFKGQENSVSMGRYPDGSSNWYSMQPATRDSVNSNLMSHVVISEFMYHPVEGQIEYIELYNPTGADAALTSVLPLAGTRGWALDGAVSYEFPTGAVLSAGRCILVVGFDPADTVQLDAFETAYGMADLVPGVDIFGPWSGALSNDGERITLERPQDSDDPLDPLAVSWIIVDECIYNDYWPWPTEADGTGQSLQRISAAAAASGNDPENWQADTPDPAQ